MEQNQQKSGKSQKIKEQLSFLIEPLSGTGEITPAKTSAFRRGIYDYYRHWGRSFPWRQTDDPYRILLSEMMLQQTQTSRVLPKYRQFLLRFPDLRDVADAALSEVFSLWQGLGYNRRAQALHRIARETGGILPDAEEDLLKLPMVGPATAAALQAFAWGRPALYLETNIRRVLLHVFFRQQDRVTDRQLYRLLSQLVDEEDPRRWYYALMDYGVFLRQAVENPNRRSAHYAKQAPFADSNRQVRGSILLVLNEKGPASVEELAGLVSFPRERVLKAMDQLCREGMVQISDYGDAAAEHTPSFSGNCDRRIVSIP